MGNCSLGGGDGILSNILSKPNNQNVDSHQSKYNISRRRAYGSSWFLLL